MSGGSLDITGIGGMAGASGILYSTTNVAALLATWTPLVTNAFDQYGVFVHTNPFSKADPKRFFILRQE